MPPIRPIHFQKSSQIIEFPTFGSLFRFPIRRFEFNLGTANSGRKPTDQRNGVGNIGPNKRFSFIIRMRKHLKPIPDRELKLFLKAHRQLRRWRNVHPACNFFRHFASYRVLFCDSWIH
jgi:hypothetical protein